MAVIAVPRMPDDQAVSLQEFLAAKGLLSWLDSEEGRRYLLCVCMVRGLAV